MHTSRTRPVIVMFDKVYHPSNTYSFFNIYENKVQVFFTHFLDGQFLLALTDPKTSLPTRTLLFHALE